MLANQKYPTPLNRGLQVQWDSCFGLNITVLGVMVKTTLIGVVMVFYGLDCMGPPRWFYPALSNLMNTLMTLVCVKATKKIQNTIFAKV